MKIDVKKTKGRKIKFSLKIYKRNNEMEKER